MDNVGGLTTVLTGGAIGGSASSIVISNGPFTIGQAVLIHRSSVFEKISTPCNKQRKIGRFGGHPVSPETVIAYV